MDVNYLNKMMRRFVYADNAATTQLDTDALREMERMLAETYGNPSQPYAFARPAKKALLEARERIASCIGALPEEIYFTSGGTESDNWALKGTAFLLHNKAKIVTSEIEHHAVLNTCRDLERVGCDVSYIPPNGKGYITTSTIERDVIRQVDIVSVMLANNEIGTIQDIRDIAEFAHREGAIVHTDAVQAIGHIPVNVHDLSVDLLSASAHKFNGPRGVGFLYVKSGTEIYPLISGGSQEHGMRAGTENVPSIVGMSIALEKNCRELMCNQEKVRTLEHRLEKRLHNGNVMYIRNGGANRLPGMLSLSFPGLSGEMILHRLDLKGICVSTGSACDGKQEEMSHVLKALHLDPRIGNGTIRISLGKYNTEEDVDDIADALIGVVAMK